LLEWVRNLVITLREEHRLKVLENRVLRRITGPKSDKSNWRAEEAA
jgi:hypothetical protein